MKEKKEVHAQERAAIEEQKAKGYKLCNNPPAEPYFVTTEEPLIAEECDTPRLRKDDFNLRLDLDTHVETAAQLDRRSLASLLTATVEVAQVDAPPANVKYIDLDLSPAELAQRFAGQGHFHAPMQPDPTTGKCEMPLKKLGQRKDHELVVVLDYPIGTDQPVAFCVTIPDVVGVAVGDIVWAIGQAYRKLYSDPARYGIWGHAMGDLYIEDIYLDTTRGNVYPSIGS